MPVQRLGHVNIRTPLVEETARFFEAALGLVRGHAATVRDQTGFVWLYDPGGAPVIHVNAPGPGEPARDAGVVSRLDHVAFDCTDPDELAARLDAAGVAYRRGLSEAGGITQINLLDPNGIKVELTFAPQA